MGVCDMKRLEWMLETTYSIDAVFALRKTPILISLLFLIILFFILIFSFYYFINLLKIKYIFKLFFIYYLIN